MSLNNFYEETSVNFQYVITFVSSSSELSGSTVLFTMKENKNDDEIIFSQSCTDITASSDTVIANFHLTPTDTDIDPGNYVYELIINYDTDDVKVVDTGAIKVIDRI